ncbi:hypothetical protein L208DRAFT_1257434, partial [Tricholoma matsutake]
RYQQIPTFGTSIRWFSSNASMMKKLAARDFEDLLQCSILVFEDLLPNQHHNILIAEMLFIFCTWHAYAKLWLHISSTLEALGKTMQALGASLREFVKVICSCYATKELPREEAAQVRHRANASAKGKGKAMVTSDKQNSARGCFNMSTYKLHALGNYVVNIQLYGLTDNYSTQVVSYFTC